MGFRLGQFLIYFLWIDVSASLCLCALVGRQQVHLSIRIEPKRFKQENAKIGTRASLGTDLGNGFGPTGLARKPYSFLAPCVSYKFLRNAGVVGSNPIGGTIFRPSAQHFFGKMAFISAGRSH